MGEKSSEEDPEQGEDNKSSVDPQDSTQESKPEFALPETTETPAEPPTPSNAAEISQDKPDQHNESIPTTETEHKQPENTKDPAGQIGWKCTVCTFHNDGDYDICAMCQRDRVQIEKERQKREMYLNMEHKKWQEENE